MADEIVPGAGDAQAKGEYFFLDMGREQYGECTVVRFGDTQILIDGAHYGDIDGQEESASVPDQLAEIFGRDGPFHFDLIVVTHCHADHIGCLPKLMETGAVTADWALLTHPGMGFGRSEVQEDDTHADLRNPRAALLSALLREEDMTFLSDAALQQFADAAATVEGRYLDFLEFLSQSDTKVIEYIGEPLPDDLLKQLKSTGIQLLGPSQNQLLFCSQQIGRENKDAADAVQDALSDDPNIDDVALYRRLVQRFEDSADGGYGRGAAMNCQSITFAFGPKGEQALLAGDMQFADPDVRGVDEEMEMLRNVVREAGPYVLFKTTHHTSHNGMDVSVLKDLGNPSLIVHSGGWNDSKHPDPSTLETLKSRRSKIKFARTDRNGLICVRPYLGLQDAIEIAEGKLNDFSDNVRDLEVSTVVAATGGTGPVAEYEVNEGMTQTVESGTAQIIIVNLPRGPVDMRVAGVEILVNTIGSIPGGARSINTKQNRPDDSAVLAGGRALPPLLFVTNSRALSSSIGTTEAKRVLAMIAARHRLLDVDANAQATAVQVINGLAGGHFAGVVIVGGYDVVPSHIVDVLDPSLRASLGNAVYDDQDHFYVWSDELFADVDGDLIGEFPVSRIPDGKDATLLLRGLSSRGLEGKEGFGIRNVRRPFAEKIWSETSSAKMEVSETFTTAALQGRALPSSYHYHMLHGSDIDGTEFTGEFVNSGGKYPVAFDVTSVPKSFGGVVFAGCCWGALPADKKAKDAALGAVRGRTAAESIALSYIRSGANAFVGCTGAHYSGPEINPNLNYAMNFHKAFWSQIKQPGASAARALYDARLLFGRQIAQKSTTFEGIDIARRLKNRSQFTCLGLGW